MTGLENMFFDRYYRPCFNVSYEIREVKSVKRERLEKRGVRKRRRDARVKIKTINWVTITTTRIERTQFIDFAVAAVMFGEAV